MPDINNITLSAGSSPTVKYTITYSKTRPSNSQMTYSFTISAALGASASVIGAGYALNCTITVNGASNSVRIKAADNDNWTGTTPRLRYTSVTCGSTAGGTEQGVTFKVVSDGRVTISSGVITNTGYFVISAPLLAAAPSVPSSISITPSIFEGDYSSGMLWSWSAASGGINAPVIGYRLQMQKSMNASSWETTGEWNVDNITSQNNMGASLQRGEYMRLRVASRSSSLTSGFSVWSNASRKNILPKAPTSIYASPTRYSTEDVTVSWSGAAGGTSSIKRFDVEESTSMNDSSWSSWRGVSSLHTSNGHGSVTVSPTRTVGTYTRYRVRAVDTLDAPTDYIISNSVYCSVSSCGAPTVCSVNSTLSEGSVTLSWSGAASGAGNAISSYEIEYSDSSDNASWGAWTALTTTSTTSTSGSVSVSPPTSRGYYRRFRVRTRGNAGVSYYSGWKISTNSVRRNTLPVAPSTFTAIPAIYQSGEVTLTWSGAAAGTSAIKNYVIQIATSTDNSAWSGFSTLTTVTTSATLGSYAYSPGSMAAFTRYRICVTDTLNATSPYAVSGIVRKNIPPTAPVVIAPKNGSVTFNKHPRILIQTQAEPDGELQTVFIKTASGAWYNSVDHSDNFSKGGMLQSGVNTIFRDEETSHGNVRITVNSKDEYAASADVTRAFTVANAPFEAIAANATTVRAAHMLTLRSAINAVRDYYGLTAYAWVSEILAGKTEVKDWSQHISELRFAVETVVDKINEFDPKGKYDIPSIEWLPLGTGRPRADVMTQLQEIITKL